MQVAVYEERRGWTLREASQGLYEELVCTWGEQPSHLLLQRAAETKGGWKAQLLPPGGGLGAGLTATSKPWKFRFHQHCWEGGQGGGGARTIRSRGHLHLQSLKKYFLIATMCPGLCVPRTVCAQRCSSQRNSCDSRGQAAPRPKAPGFSSEA